MLVRFEGKQEKTDPKAEVFRERSIRCGQVHSNQLLLLVLRSVTTSVNGALIYCCPSLIVGALE